jgi:lipopolysaccharide exporter
VQGIFLALNYWNSRTRHFGRLSIARITTSLATTLGKLGFGYAGYAGSGTQIGTTVAGQAIATTVLGGQIWRDDRKIFLTAINWKRMREGVIRHKKFALYGTWSSLMNTISSSLPALMLAPFFSSTVVGFFALGQRILGMPMSLMGSAVAQVFFPRAAEARHNGTLHVLVGKAFSKLLSMGIFVFLIVMIAGRELFSVVFGNHWAEAGFYAQILAPWIMFQFISSPMSTLFSVLEMQEVGLIFNSILLVTRVASLAIGGILQSIVLSLALFSVSGALLYLGLCILILKKSGTKLSMLSRHIVQTAGIAAIAILPVLIFKISGTGPLFSMGAAILSLLIYYGTLYLRDEELQQLFARFLR